MSKRCELQKEYYKEYGNYKGDGKYSDGYVAWLEDKIVKNNVALGDVSKRYCADCGGDITDTRYEFVCEHCRIQI